MIKCYVINLISYSYGEKKKQLLIKSVHELCIKWSTPFGGQLVANKRHVSELVYTSFE